MSNDAIRKPFRLKTVSLAAVCILSGAGCGSDRSTPLQGTSTPETAGLRSSLEIWLHDHHRVANAMRFDGAEGWHQWPQPQKDQLAQDFIDFTVGHPIDLQDPLTNYHDNSMNPDERLIAAVAEYRNEDVWRLYVNLVAYSLKVELHGEVPWSVVNYSDRSLNALFSGYELFVQEAEVRPRNFAYRHFERPDSFTVRGPALATTAARAQTFVETHSILADTPIDTIGNALTWARSNLIHHGYFEGDNTWSAYMKHWGYGGPAPVVRILDGWSHPERFAGAVRNYTAGCGGTTSTLRAVLRVVNIPVTSASFQTYDTGGHSLTRFPSVDMNLSHGDDPYATRRTTQPWPITELLIDDDTFESWFFPITGSNDDNVGRQAREIRERYE